MSDEVVYHHPPKTQDCGETTPDNVEPEAVEKSDRGLFDHFGKKEDNKCEEAAISSDFQHKVHVSESEPKSEEKKESFLQKLHRSSSSSSSSSEEEYEENGEKKKRKKPLKEKIKEKLEGHKEKKEDEKHEDDTCVPIEKYEEAPPPSSEAVHPVPTPEPEEKKGFLEKIKEKLPGGHKKAEEEHAVAPPPPPPVAAPTHDEDKEKKGIFEKIKEKIPGYHSKSEEEKEKEKVKECD